MAEVDPFLIYALMGAVDRPREDVPNHWKELENLARQLEDVVPQDLPSQEILASGWHREGTRPNGEVYIEQEREVLGRGIPLFSSEICAKVHNVEPNQETRRSVIVAVWRLLEGGPSRYVFLAFAYHRVIGSIGPDNQQGIDTTWRVMGLRILPIPSSLLNG